MLCATPPPPPRSPAVQRQDFWQQQSESNFSFMQDKRKSNFVNLKKQYENKRVMYKCMKLMFCPVRKKSLWYATNKWSDMDSNTLLIRLLNPNAAED